MHLVQKTSWIHIFLVFEMVVKFDRMYDVSRSNCSKSHRGALVFFILEVFF